MAVAVRQGGWDPFAIATGPVGARYEVTFFADMNPVPQRGADSVLPGSLLSATAALAGVLTHQGDRFIFTDAQPTVARPETRVVRFRSTDGQTCAGTDLIIWGTRMFASWSRGWTGPTRSCRVRWC